MGILTKNSDPAALWGEQLNEVTDLTLAKADDSAVYAGEASAFTLTAENVAGQKLEIDSHAVEFDGATVGITEATSDHLTLSCTFAEEGEATLTATYEGLTASIDVTVEEAPVRSISFDTQNYNFAGDEGQFLTADFAVTTDKGDDVTADCTYSVSPSNTGLVVDGTTGTIDPNAVAAGDYNVSLTATYGQLTAHAGVTMHVENDNIVFVDSAVKAICVANWGSGGEITEQQAAAVTTLLVGEPGEMESAFYTNTVITSFNELEYFTGLTTVEEAFYGCTSLADVTLPSTLTSVGDYAFQETALTSIDIPSGVTAIGQDAFRSCSSLASVTVNATTPPTLGTDAFSGTSRDLAIYVPAASVDAYKAASGWSDFASVITAISEV